LSCPARREVTAMKKTPGFDLTDAYAVETPQDSVRLYRDWAQTYDATFAEQRGYCYPESLAETFMAMATPENTPVLDVGAGTGLVAKALKARGDVVVDAIDISSEMLGISQQKGLYREYFLEDLTAGLTLPDNSYGGIVSAGTFTHGHVGPVALDELLRVGRSGALYCLGINGSAFDKYGFGSAFAALNAQGLISPLEFASARIYSKASDEHADDIAYTVIFRKA